MHLPSSQHSRVDGKAYQWLGLSMNGLVSSNCRLWTELIVLVRRKSSTFIDSLREILWKKKYGVCIVHAVKCFKFLSCAHQTCSLIHWSILHFCVMQRLFCSACSCSGEFCMKSCIHLYISLVHSFIVSYICACQVIKLVTVRSKKPSSHSLHISSKLL